jgi:hypothetical protein
MLDERDKESQFKSKEWLRLLMGLASVEGVDEMNKIKNANHSEMRLKLRCIRLRDG